MKSAKLHPYFILHLGIFLVSFTGVLGKAISLREGVLVWYRMLFSIVILGAFIILSKRWRPVQKKDRFKALSIGALFALHWILWYGSIKVSNASIAMSCISTVAIFTAILEPLTTKAKFKLRDILLALMGGLGMYLVYMGTEANRLGVILGVISAFVVAIASTFNKPLSERNDPYNLTLTEFSGAFLFCTLSLPLYLTFFPQSNLVPTANDFGLLMVFVVLCTLAPFILNLYALKHVSAFSSNLSFNMEPVWGILAAVIFYKEHKTLSFQFFFGLSLILLSVVVYSFIKFTEMRKNAAISNG